MKVGYININTNILLAKEKDNIFEFISKKLLECGFTFSFASTIQGTYEHIKNTIESNKEKIYIIVGDTNSARNLAIKNILTKYLGTQTYKNNEIVQFLKEYYKLNELAPNSNIENESVIPIGAIHLVNKTSELQGFIYKSLDKWFIFVPNDLNAIKDIYENQLKLYLCKILNSNYSIATIKTYGINEKDLLLLLKDHLKSYSEFLLTTYADDLDITINIRYLTTIDGEVLREYLSTIYTILDKYIYATEDISIYKTAFDLIKLTKKTLSVTESSTISNITKNFLECDNYAKNILINSATFTKESALLNEFNSDKQIIDQYKLFSVENAYKIAVNMLDKYKTDFVVVTCGEIPNEKTNLNNLQTFIAVGDSDGIHVYKNIFKGTSHAIIKSISKSAIFYLIRKIKQNALIFNKTTI